MYKNFGLGHIKDEEDQRDYLWREAVMKTPVNLPAKFRLNSLGKVLDQKSTSQCFPLGTQVRLEDGSTKPIEDIKLLDRVVTAEGNVGAVLAVGARFHIGHLINVQIWGHSHLRLTPEHPILTEKGYVPAKELTGDDYVAMTKHLKLSVDTIYTSDYVSYDSPSVSKKRKNTRTYAGYGNTITVQETKTPDSICLNRKFGRLLGLYAAEGSSRAKGYESKWSFNSKETDRAVFRKVKALVYEEFAGYVYNLQVEGDESYVAEGVGVHNCVAYSSASLKMHQEFKEHKKYYSFDPHWLYALCKKNDQIPNQDGTYIRVALKIVQEQGYLAKAQRYKLKQDTNFKIDAYVRLNSIDEIFEAIYYVGPVVAGIQFDDGLFNPDQNGIIPEPNGKSKYGHAVTICGWNKNKKCQDSVGALLVKNSWGTDWGKKGYFWLPLSYLERYPNFDAWRAIDSKDLQI